MHRGCIALGDIQCDDCHSTIPYAERYLVFEETEGSLSRLCIRCCLNRGYAHYKVEKGAEVLTCFIE